MTIKLSALLVTIGALVFGIGLILGLTSMSQGGSNCGSAFSANPVLDPADPVRRRTVQPTRHRTRPPHPRRTPRRRRHPRDVRRSHEEGRP